MAWGYLGQYLEGYTEDVLVHLLHRRFLVLSFSLVVVHCVSLLGAISADSEEWIQINAIRFPLAKIAYLLCSRLVPALIA
ncbi:hypothetical protein M8013_00580 [Enterobacteriaceae bacterium H4N4]|uniref:Uncharacterized protein n=1 Tax=Silvania confinis TaxID=2926470 RepID=A0A9J6Q883_9ENTR|nr:hypothetical protein [Silvania confinis]MCU6667257.1 hypothetical protein [Silvania confinis]